MLDLFNYFLYSVRISYTNEFFNFNIKSFANAKKLASNCLADIFYYLNLLENY